MAIIVYDDDTISLVCNEPINIINTNNNNIPPKKIHIFFNYYNNPPYPLNVEKNEKIKDVFNRYAQENEKDINQLDFFFYKNENNLLKIDSNGEKTVLSLSNVSEKIKQEEIVINIIVKQKEERFDIINTNTNIINPTKKSQNLLNNRNIVDDDDDERIIINEEKRINKYIITLKKRFYKKIFIPLFIQHSIILLAFIFGFYYDINEILINLDVHIIIKYAPVISIIVIALSISVELFTREFDLRIVAIIFNIFYPPFIVYYGLLLSEYLDYKYFIMGSGLVLLVILSLGIHLLLFDNTRKIYMFLNSFILSLIGLIAFSYFWIKSLYPIIYVSSFWLGINLLFLLWVHLTKLFEEFKTIYFVFLFDYNILIGIAFILEKFLLYFFIFLFYSLYQLGKGIRYICVNICECLEDWFQDYSCSKITLKFLVLLIQYTFIWIGFSSKLNELYKYGYGGFDFGMTIGIIGSFLICYYLLCGTLDKEDIGCLGICCIIFYIPIMIFFYLIFSTFFDKQYILAFILIIDSNLLINIIFLVFFKSEIFVLLFCIISDVITILPFHFFWFNSEHSFSILSIMSACIAVYLTVCSCITLETGIGKSVLIFNNGLFVIVYGIIVGIGLIIAAIYNGGCDKF